VGEGLFFILKHIWAWSSKDKLATPHVLRVAMVNYELENCNVHFLSSKEESFLEGVNSPPFNHVPATICNDYIFSNNYEQGFLNCHLSWIIFRSCLYIWTWPVNQMNLHKLWRLYIASKKWIKVIRGHVYCRILLTYWWISWWLPMCSIVYVYLVVVNLKCTFQTQRDEAQFVFCVDAAVPDYSA